MGAHKNLLILGELHSPSPERPQVRPFSARLLDLTRLREAHLPIIARAQNRVAACERDLQKAQARLARLQGKSLLLLSVAKRLSAARRDVLWAELDLKKAQHALKCETETLADIDAQLSELGGK